MYQLRFKSAVGGRHGGHSPPIPVKRGRGSVGLLRGHLQRDVVVDTTEPQQIVDITNQVQEIIRVAAAEHEDASGGIVTVSSQHTTCSVILNENEHFLKHDIINYLNETVPPDPNKYKHNDLMNRPATDRDREAIEKNNFGGYGSVEEFMRAEPINAHAHLQAIICGNSVTVGVKDARLSLGSWQSILFLELDGPRHGRRATVSFVW